MACCSCFLSYCADGIHSNWRSKNERACLSEKLTHKWVVVTSEGPLPSAWPPTVHKRDTRCLNVRPAYPGCSTTIASDFNVGWEWKPSSFFSLLESRSMGSHNYRQNKLTAKIIIVFESKLFNLENFLKNFFSHES